VTTVRQKQPTIPLGRADMLAALAMREAQQLGLPADEIVTVGGLRRYAPALDGIRLLAVAPVERHREVLAGFGRLPMVRSVSAHSSRRIKLGTERGSLEVQTAAPEVAGAAMAWHTGTTKHVRWLQKRAAMIDLRFTEDGLHGTGGLAVHVPDEATLYRLLELPFVAPELREGDEEIGAAEKDLLPSLVSPLHIRGDLHMHSTWSDGRDSILHMVLSAQRLGYEYVAITDHSERSWASRKLLALEVPIQRQEIEAARAQARGIEILHGIEVDIMPDGSLDFDDETLAQFDIVLASLHDAHGHDRHTLMQRYLRAMSHPLVNIITHPANRSPGLSDGYDLNFERLFEAAVETGTAMEIDGAPGHLDMDGRLARRAVASGVTVVINSDCHRADALGRQMSFGIGTARRGWVKPDHVLNTRGVAAIREFVARKRSKG